MRAFREKIINLLYNIVTERKRVRSILTPIFAIIFFSFILSLILTSLYLDHFFKLPRFISPPWSFFVSLPFLASGTSLWLWCVWTFFKNNGTPVPTHPPPKLITDGPYAYSRNPMMTGLFIAMAGLGVFFGSITLTFVATPIFISISILEFKYFEEPELEKRFGKEYAIYKEKISIIIPTFRKNS